MCGIAGIIRLGQPTARADAQAMTGRLSHRGPDGAGIYARENVALGHRRLSIIDPEGGKQPMSDDTGSYWITFNGEIYNYQALRAQLAAKGYQFRSNSDTEVLLYAYRAWGKNCVKHLRGMFAFAIADFTKRLVFLANDQFGIKPLYYAAAPGFFSFASELQAFAALEDFRPTLDLEALDQYLWLQYIPAPATIFRHTHKLPPAHCFSVSFEGKASAPECYWNLAFRPDNRRSEKDWLAGLDQVLRDSVKAHLVADVPFGAFLSGGIDSTTVVNYMSQLLDQPVKTFSIGFEEVDFNELAYAKVVADQWKTDHYVQIVKPDALAILPDLVKHYGEPFGDSSAIPTYYVCQLARQHVPMVLSGDGGDEAFAGYHSYAGWMKAVWLNKPEWKRKLYPLAHQLFPGRFPVRNTLEKWLSFIHYLPKDWRMQLWRPEYRHLAEGKLPVFEEAFRKARHYAPANQVQYADLKTYLPFDILTKVDRVSMFHSLEVRTPLVDKEVWEFAATIPEHFNVQRSKQGQWEGKLLLKKLNEPYYTEGFIYRKKMGFGVPIVRWFAADGEYRHVLEDRLLGHRSVLHRYFEPAAIRKLIDINFTGPVWLLLFLDEWLEQFFAKYPSVSHDLVK